MTAQRYRKVISELRPHIEALAEVAGYPRWYATNIIVWRASRRLPIEMGKVLDA